MWNFIKNNYFKLCIIIAYTIIACLVYGIWTYSAWTLWYVTLIIVIAICILGAVIGYIWLKSENKQIHEN